jgi:Transcriptional regulator/sugar kinase
MIGSGLLFESGLDSEANGLGRKTRFVDINPSSGAFLGLEIRAGGRRSVITDLKGRIIASLSDEKMATEYDAAIESAASLVKKLLENSGFSYEKINAIAVAVPGLVDRKRGRLEIFPSYNWEKKPVLSDLRAKLCYEGDMLLENNVIGRAYAMSIFDASKLTGADTLAYMYVSTGIASPLLGSVRLHFGSVRGDGEVGHMVMNPSGPLCRCGNHGCLEAYSSEYAMAKSAMAAVEKGICPILQRLYERDGECSVDIILEAEREGSKTAGQIIDTAIEYLGLAIANIDNFVRPECIAVEARIFESELHRKRLLDIMHRNLYRGVKSDPLVLFVPANPLSGARGAAAVAVMSYLEK